MQVEFPKRPLRKIKVTKVTKAKVEKLTSTKPEQELNFVRLARLKGQLDGIEKMMRDGRYCTEILQQIKSASSALKGLECIVLENHLRGCVKKAFEASSPFDAQTKITELVELMRTR